MKRSIVMIMMVAMIGLVSVTAVIAEGAQERADDTARPQRPFYDSEKVSLSGTVELTAAGVELTAEDGQKYDLMYPRFLAEGVEIETGDRVAVEGFLVPGPRRRWDAEEDKNYLRIEKATVDGEEYELAGGFGPDYMHGHRPRSGTYGPGKMGRR